MQALENKIFEFLSNKVSVLEFETWLYNSEEFISQINTNSFYFDIISINYRENNCIKMLEKILCESLDDEKYMMYLTIYTCSQLNHSKSSKNSYEILRYFINYFDYGSNSIIQNKLYNLYYDYDLFEIGIYDEYEFNHAVAYTSNDIIKQFYSSSSLEEKLSFINEKQSVNNSEIFTQNEHSRTLKQKIFAFFKKI